jgi:hypothetical protein
LVGFGEWREEEEEEVEVASVDSLSEVSLLSGDSVVIAPIDAEMGCKIAEVRAWAPRAR